MKYLCSILLCSMLLACQQNEPRAHEKNSIKTTSESLEVLLLGTFHFANFNPENNGDIINVTVPDVLAKENQLELEKIAEAIAEFKPDKIFLEYPFTSQTRLDSIYTNFSATDYNKVARNERHQLGFRVAKLLNHKRVYAMDVRTHFPFDSLMTQMEKAKQYDLITKDSLEVIKVEAFENELFSSDITLSEILFYENDSTRRKEDINWYLSLANQVGEKDNFVGSYLTSEWYKRNLYMYSIVQKAIEQKDAKIMILAGASHIAMFKDFIDYNPEWKAIELIEIMEK